MAVLTAFLFFIFGQYRTGFDDTGIRRCSPTCRVSSRGRSVRVAGIRVGTVDSVSLRPDKKVVVKFDADRNIVLTDGHQGSGPLPQPGRRSLPRTRRRPGIDQGAAGRAADPGRPHRAGA